MKHKYYINTEPPFIYITNLPNKVCVGNGVLLTLLLCYENLLDLNLYAFSPFSLWSQSQKKMSHKLTKFVKKFLQSL